MTCARERSGSGALAQTEDDFIFSRVVHIRKWGEGQPISMSTHVVCFFKNSSNRNKRSEFTQVFESFIDKNPND